MWTPYITAVAFRVYFLQDAAEALATLLPLQWPSLAGTLNLVNSVVLSPPSVLRMLLKDGSFSF